jgi:hypothetical protein
MKKNFAFFIFFAIAFGVYCHPSIKIFAFEQESRPGTVPAGVTNENGNPVKKAAAKKNYFVFLSFKNKYDVVPLQVFIKGNSFDVKTVNTKETPVEYTSRNIPDNPEKQLLVPETDNKVIEIILTEAAQSSIPEDAHLKKLTASNDVVVVYNWKQKKHFASLKTIKTLTPVMNE